MRILLLGGYSTYKKLIRKTSLHNKLIQTKSMKLLQVRHHENTNDGHPQRMVYHLYDNYADLQLKCDALRILRLFAVPNGTPN